MGLIWNLVFSGKMWLVIGKGVENNDKMLHDRPQPWQVGWETRTGGV